MMTFLCFGCCRNRVLGTGHVPLKEIAVKLDTSRIGSDVVIVKNGTRICGTGAALANSPIVQDKAYFEIKIQFTGIWGFGLATEACNIDSVPLGNHADAWVLRNDGSVVHNNEKKSQLPDVPQEGDIIGMTYDHTEMNFFLNGVSMNVPVTGIKGTVYPAFYVESPAVLDVHFDRFFHQPVDGFDRIMIEQSLLELVELVSLPKTQQQKLGNVDSISLMELLIQKDAELKSSLKLGDPRRPYPTDLDMRQSFLGMSSIPDHSQQPLSQVSSETHTGVGVSGAAASSVLQMVGSSLSWQPSQEVSHSIVSTASHHIPHEINDVELMSTDTSSSSSSDE